MLLVLVVRDGSKTWCVCCHTSGSIQLICSSAGYASPIFSPAYLEFLCVLSYAAVAITVVSLVVAAPHTHVHIPNSRILHGSLYSLHCK